MDAKMVRWGILSTANIARKNWKAIRNSGNGIVAAVASRDLSRAQQFISECQAHTPMGNDVKAFASYEELLASSEIDAVYIPLPTGLRKEWVLRAAKAGKHVLCEKPCAVNVADLREMIEACRVQRVQFMDGVMFMHSMRLAQIQEFIKQDGIGQVKRITSAFSFHADDEFYGKNIRGSSELEPFGCLGDLGWYCVRLALCVAGFQSPREVTGRVISEVSGGKSAGAVPVEFSGEMVFENGITASFYSSFAAANEQWAIITGTKGFIRIPDFVLPFYGSDTLFEVYSAHFDVQGCDFNMQPNRLRIAVPEYSNSHSNAQETNMVREFARVVRSGTPDEFWPKAALLTQEVMERCLQSAQTTRASH
jgi:predicted dehydrogenase